MTHLVSTDELARLTDGSFEGLTARLNEAVAGQNAEGNPRVIATFPSHVIVARENGKFSKIAYEAKDGAVALQPEEFVAVTTYGDDKLQSFIDANAKKIIDMFFSGKMESAKEGISGLVEAALHAPPPVPEDVQLAAILFKINEESLWKKVYAESADQIQALLGDLFTSLSEAKLISKFEELAEVPTEKHESYRTLVTSELMFLLGRAHELETRVANAAESSDVKAGMDEAEQAIIGSYLAFCEDLIADLSKIRAEVTEALSTQKSVAFLGKLYDGAVTSFHTREVAAAYATKVAEQLAAE